MEHFAPPLPLISNPAVSNSLVHARLGLCFPYAFLVFPHHDYQSRTSLDDIAHLHFQWAHDQLKRSAVYMGIMFTWIIRLCPHTVIQQPLVITSFHQPQGCQLEFKLTYEGTARGFITSIFCSLWKRPGNTWVTQLSKRGFPCDTQRHAKVAPKQNEKQLFPDFVAPK